MRKSLLAVALALAACGPSEPRYAGRTAAEWADRIGSADAAVAGTARMALSTLGDAAVEPLIAKLASSDARERRIAAELLGQLGERARAAVPRLVEVRRDSAPEVRAAVAEALPSIVSDDTSAIEGPLLEMLADADAPVRASAAAGLGRIASVRAIPALASRLEDAEPRVRSVAAEALGSLSTETAGEVDRIAAALRDSEPSVRVWAARILGDLGPVAARFASELVHALDDPDPAVRAMAAESLGLVGGAAERPALEQVAARDAVPAVRNAASGALELLAADEADVSRGAPATSGGPPGR